MTAVNRRVMRKHNEKMVRTDIPGILSRVALGPDQFVSPLRARLVKLNVRKCHKHKATPGI